MPAAKRTTRSRRPAARRSRPGVMELRLYVAGSSRRCNDALANLTRICEEHLPGRHRIEVVDLLEHPRLAAGEQILAVPTVIKRVPLPIRRVIGDLSDTEKVLIGLDLRVRST